ncbi:O-antigen ligase [Marinilabiliaceae bacterium ANBcel2]|nr:O-antigen ligase [Marinilabiliaceae bacterium ANBcel2]
MKTPFAIVFHPLGYIIVLWIIYFLSLFENPLGWGASYGVRMLDYSHLYIIYTVSFLAGGGLTYFVNKKLHRNTELVLTNPVSLRIKLILIIALLFFVARFIHIKDIPLLGDPFSRYRSNLGGFPDYPTRLLAPLGALSFLFYKKYRKAPYLKFFVFSIGLMILYTWRQEALSIIIGVIMLLALHYEFSVRRLIRFGITGFLFFFVMIGLLGIVRFGDHGLDGLGELYGLAMGFLHGEITTSQKFGAYVLEELNGDYLGGIYTLGIFKSLFVLDFDAHGAEYLRQNFSSAFTAQSVGVPFGYVIDFGIIGLIFMGFIVGYMTYFLYRSYINQQGFLSVLIFITYYLQLMFSLRSGGLPFSPVFIYITLGLMFIFFNEIRGRLFSEFVPIIILGYLGTLLLSLIFLIIRI